MARRFLQAVDVWPDGGHVDEAWDPDPAADAFCRSAKAVTPVHSRALRALRLPALVGWVRLGCTHRSDDDRVHVTVPVDRHAGDLEILPVALPPGVAALAPADRRRLVLAVTHAGLVRLGEARGWDPALLERARAEAEATGLVEHEESAWVASPDRRHRARLLGRVADDGFDRTRIQVAERDGEVVVTSAEVLGGVRRRRPRWEGSAAVAVQTYPGGFRRRQTSVRLDLVDGTWRSTTQGHLGSDLPVPGADATPGAPLPAIEVVGVGVDAPEDPPHVIACGGGPTNGVAPAYLAAVEAGFAALASPAGQVWWRGSGLRQLELTYWFGPGPDVTCRRSGPRLRACVRRPAASTHATPEQTAAQDVTDVLDAVRRRTGLGPHPAWPARD